MCRSSGHDIAIQDGGGWQSVEAWIWEANTCARLTRTLQSAPTTPQVPIKPTALPGERMLESVSSQLSILQLKNNAFRDFLVGAVDRNLPANAGDTGSFPGPGRFHMAWDNQAHTAWLLSPHSKGPQATVLSPHTASTSLHAACCPHA